MPVNSYELQRLKNIVDRSSFIKMAIQLGRKEPYEPYQVYPDSLTTNFGINRDELHAELSNLARSKQIQPTLPSFTATWADPNILTTHTPEQVIQLKGSGMFRQKGYLFFCLGAENPNRSKTQFVDPSQIMAFYGIAIADFFADLGRLVGEKTLTTDIDRITVQWLAYSGSNLQTTPTETVASSLEDMLKRLNELSARVAKLESAVISANNGTISIPPSPSGFPQTSIIRINCAGTEYTDSTGKTWQAENYSVGGGGGARPIIVEDTLDQDLFATIRWGLDGYDIPVSAGSYTVKLYFVEPESPHRKFNIILQGQVKQADFNIYSEAGEFGKVLVKTFTNISATDVLSIRFNPTVQDAIISAIEVLQ